MLREHITLRLTLLGLFCGLGDWCQHSLQLYCIRTYTYVHIYLFLHQHTPILRSLVLHPSTSPVIACPSRGACPQLLINRLIRLLPTNLPTGAVPSGTYAKLASLIRSGRKANNVTLSSSVTNLHAVRNPCCCVCVRWASSVL